VQVIKWIFIILAAVVLVSFSIENKEIIKVIIPLYLYEVSAPSYMIFFGLVIIGIIMGGSLSFMYRILDITSSRRLKKRIKVLEDELSAMKAERKIIDSVKTEENEYKS